MDPETNESEVVEHIDEVEEEAEEETSAEPTDDVATLKARLAKLEEKAIAQRERTRLLRQELAKVKPKADAPKQDDKKPGELDETQLDYLDLKGITDEDEIAVIQKVMARTGQTVRQALKDDYVVSKLEALRGEKQVKAATPSATKRGGNQTTDIDTAIAKFDQTGTLPEDYALRTQVVNAVAARANPNKPGWH